MTNQEFLKQIGHKLSALRKEKGMSQVEVCSKLKMDKTYLSAIENGNQNTSINTIKEILEAMNCSVDQLFKL